MLLKKILQTVVGEDNTLLLFQTLVVPRALMTESEKVTRAHIAQALNMVLFHDLLQRVPSGAKYVDKKIAENDKVVFDHGALRTVAWGDNGNLPQGRASITRVLEALGYTEAAIYPLPRLKMTGYAYQHVDHPADIAQYFVSELHPELFSQPFQQAVTEILSSSVDPLSAHDLALLDRLKNQETISLDEAAQIVKAGVSCFSRHHNEPRINDYETLKAESAEMAWIATEGNVFNHATDRVPDVFAAAATLRAEGARIKDKVEISATGRVRQTALMADKVSRGFIDDKGGRFMLDVPGSFYEFISRDKLPDTDTIDLAFDTGNATGIFNVTAAR